MAMTPHVLIVAGSDSSGGAGIARDIETVSAFGLRSCLAVTAVTVQTHTAVERVEQMPPELIAAQMHAAFAANQVAAVKIGVLGTAAAIRTASSVLARNRQVPVVLDPVLASSSGGALLEEDAIDALRRDLIPACHLVTPNLLELAALTGSALALDEEAACQQGKQLSNTARTAVLVKGGHAQGSQAVDLLIPSDGPATRFGLARLQHGVRGTGCMLSSAIAASLALSISLEDSVRRAKRYVFEIIAQLQ
ncbi:hydroxymethylpyrimidine/phosphomethylpyrimidine kinase [Mesorhizobium sp.]|uniref:hydroxymethylpyrimidine/phosphomethylpyrimidine kinase n=1 Tax=Mesorhizobium sp. TaxID=1871066 RepID=UPI000FE3DE54|nr:hydroxymethylpyrimidine/phosphomethylpyrimidine kinase [Mesorhizobium sp.]RWH67354.1 MAG: hydroxymethylpyrimidine/phosphomethylpyrimidine kinase [Mesorhizobium sp.]RWL23315.1 MAG: hydroxymethylpyrimidine/phosphomethylpyrimidine kinase [Mesorhizobium sp.]RWL25924.1 MAG: hydroxymethylpyrimidine/phosphomethylpyrimidine kinase [Mesorhizobium sp.]RWL32765.1 MAG: hydroxymethylpyrimidine/phosphomethylpyrimidine kinase [Mesorhizobium sp.]RWL52283.1 MAG: hydroxymethylpyrimidine/phosphomethylpyrimidi